MDPGKNAIRAEGAESLVAADWPTLTRLTIDEQAVGDGGKALLEERLADRVSCR